MSKKKKIFRGKSCHCPSCKIDEKKNRDHLYKRTIKKQLEQELSNFE